MNSLNKAGNVKYLPFLLQLFLLNLSHSSRQIGRVAN